MRLFLVFLVVPLIEIALFIQIGGAIGLGWTLLTVILTAILGTVLVRSQGLAVLSKLRDSMEGLTNPAEPLAHGAMILFSGALLLTPGFFTDAVGFALLVPRIRSQIFEVLRKRVVIHDLGHRDSSRQPNRPDIVDAEFEEIHPSENGESPSGWTRH